MNSTIYAQKRENQRTEHIYSVKTYKSECCQKLPNLWCVSRGGLSAVICPLIASENKPPQDDVKEENLREISAGA